MLSDLQGPGPPHNRDLPITSLVGSPVGGSQQQFPTAAPCCVLSEASSIQSPQQPAGEETQAQRICLPPKVIAVSGKDRVLNPGLDEILSPL